jgi:hypothetical protein
MLRFLQKKTRAATRPTSAWIGFTLLAIAFTGASPAAFPINLKQDKNAQDKNFEAAKLFVGTWKGKHSPDAIIDSVLIFKMEGTSLKGTQREFAIRRESGGEPKIVRDEYVPLPDLNVEGKKLTWKKQWNLPDTEKLSQVTLISDDEIIFESVGMNRSSGQPTLIIPVSYKLKREK